MRGANERSSREKRKGEGEGGEASTNDGFNFVQKRARDVAFQSGTDRPIKPEQRRRRGKFLWRLTRFRTSDHAASTSCAKEQRSEGNSGSNDRPPRSVPEIERAPRTQLRARSQFGGRSPRQARRATESLRRRPIGELLATFAEIRCRVKNSNIGNYGCGHPSP